MKVVISGYHGCGNLGDEVTLAALLEELRSRFPVLEEVVVLTCDPERTARDHGVRAVGRWNPWALRRELQGARAFLSGGGELIQDRTSRRSALYYLGGIALARRRAPVFLVGQGIGPLRSRLTRAWARHLLPRAEAALVRDEGSAERLRRWGLAGERLFVGSDLTFLRWPRWASLRSASPSPFPSGGEADPSGRTYLAVCLKGRRSRAFRRALAAQLDRLLEARGVRTVFVALHPREDKEAMEQVAGQMRHRALVLDPGGVGHEEVIATVGGAVAVVGMRLHALIFAALAGRPFVALGDDPKVEALLRQLKGSGWPEIPRWTSDQVRTRTLDLAETLDRLRASERGRRAPLIRAGEALYRLTRRAMDGFLERLAEHLSPEEVS